MKTEGLTILRTRIITHRPDMDKEPARPPSPQFPVLRAPLPLGEWVETWAKPIAVWLDRVAKTKLAGCSACSRRRRLLNWVVPDMHSARSWFTAVTRLTAGWRAVYKMQPPSAGSKL